HHEGFPIKRPYRSIVPIRDNDLVEFRNVNYALRLTQTRDTPKPFALGKVYHLERVISQSRDEQSLAFKIHAEVIDPSFHSGHRNGLSQFQRTNSLAVGGRDAKNNDQQKHRTDSFHDCSS